MLRAVGEGGAQFIRTVRLDLSQVERAKLPPALAQLETLDFTTPATFFVGANGSGKSTLLEAVAVAAGLNPEGGSRNLRFATRSSHSVLHQHITLVRKRVPRTDYFLRAESFYNVASELDTLAADDPRTLRSYGGRSLHEQSHGESFLALAVERFGPDGLYLLDEPEAALSPQGQLTLLRRMHELIQGRSQFIVVTHSPILIALPGAAIIEFGDDGLVPVEFDLAEQVVLYRAFLDDPNRFLHHLLREDDPSE